ncbi:MAG: TIGR03089 family protein, partial [Jiangellaceae bacterium]
MAPAPSTPSELLRAELRRDGTRPLVTFYDDATGERVELSVITFENWVAKTAGLLQEGLSAEVGSRIGLALPAHWQSLAWGAAGWAIGACVVAGPVDEFTDVDVAVAGPDTLDATRASGAHDVVALALRPLGGRFTTPLPDGVLDYAVEAPGYPDRFTPYDVPA